MSYTNKCLYIDLTSGKFEIKSTDKELIEKSIKTRGLNLSKVLSKLSSPKTFNIFDKNLRKLIV